MEKAGCKVDATAEGGFFKVEHCHGKVAGGFRPDSGVVVCQNHVKSQQEVDNLLAHELIHAFDHCRVRDLDWNNCLHHTCSEIRAANLSGDCHWKMEVMRGNFSLKKQHQECIKRRAKLSIEMNPACQGCSDEAIEQCFQKCFADTAPFDQIP